MGKVLIIKGTDFSSVAVNKIYIDPNIPEEHNYEWAIDLTTFDAEYAKIPPKQYDGSGTYWSIENLGTLYKDVKKLLYYPFEDEFGSIAFYLFNYDTLAIEQIGTTQSWNSADAKIEYEFDEAIELKTNETILYRDPNRTTYGSGLKVGYTLPNPNVLQPWGFKVNNRKDDLSDSGQHLNNFAPFNVYGTRRGTE